MSQSPPSYPNEFAVLLRRYRRARGLSQEELADKAGISVTSVSYFERGLTRTPHRDTIQLLSVALNLSEEEAAAFLQATRRARARDYPHSASVSMQMAEGEVVRDETTAIPVKIVTEVTSSYRLLTPLTPLLGRAQDEATILDLLMRESVRLLTVTGPAGVGKTRLALQCAALLHERVECELVFVDLVAVSQSVRVLSAIAESLGVRDTGDQPLLDATITAMGSRHLLLVLDNFEHVLDAAPLCAVLLGACPTAKALVTSRAALNIRGEYEIGVRPLPVPRLAELPPLAELAQFGSVALFMARSQAVQPDFVLTTEEQGRMVSAICARLDGLPLAIELAAAQVKFFTLDELLTQLEGTESLEILAGGPRDLADHQRAMRSTVAWSYELLPTEAQRVFCALGVFAGGVTLDGIEEVAALEHDVTLTCLTMLVDANLVQAASDSFGRRYDQLVIIRSFALAQLRVMGELDATRRRLANYIIDLVEKVKPVATDVHTLQLNRLLPEHDNIRAVLDWIVENGELLIGMRLSGGLRYFWERRGFAVEGAAWVKRLLDRAPLPNTAEERAIHAIAWEALLIMNHRLGRFQEAAAAGEQALALARESGEANKIAKALNGLANPLLNVGAVDRAEALFLESLAIFQAEGDRVAEETSLLNLGELRIAQGRYQEALIFQQEALAISHAIGEQEAGRALLLSNTGETYIMMDRAEDALRILLESQHFFEELNEPSVLALYNLGRATWRMGHGNEALSWLNKATHLSRKQSDATMLVQELCVVASVAFDLGRRTLAHNALEEAKATVIHVTDRRIHWRVVERAAEEACQNGLFAEAICLYSLAEQGRTATNDLVDPEELDRRARDRKTALEALGEQAFVEAQHNAKDLSLQEALELANAVPVLPQSRE